MQRWHGYSGATAAEFRVRFLLFFASGHVHLARVARQPDTLYHLYNRGNNRQRIFFSQRNYEYFTRKAQAALSPHADILAYCLMPNHFHFLLMTRPDLDSVRFSLHLRIWLSSYSQAIQRQQGTTGSLFQQNTKAKHIESDGHALQCFYYIHQNPVKAGLVQKIEQWRHSSFRQYWKGLSGIANIKAGYSYLDLPVEKREFYSESINEAEFL